MFKKIIILAASLLLLTSCGQKTDSNTIKNPDNTNANIKVVDESFNFNDSKENSSSLITYPVVSQMTDESLQKTVNQKIKDDALSVLKQYDYQAKDTKIEIKYEIKTINSRAVSIAFSGNYTQKDSPYPISIFYTSNIDLTTGKNIRFTELCDVSSVANWLTTSKTFKALSTDSALATAQNDYILTLKADDLQKQLETADFDDKSTFPTAFSYFESGNLMVSISVTHALGDHAEYILPTSSIK